MGAGPAVRMQTRVVRHPQGNATGGKRGDLGGRYFRSRAEANIARLFTHLGIPWEYEPQEFQFPVERGTRTYIPDFRIDLTPWQDKARATQGWPRAFLRLAPEEYWVEVKGWFDRKSQTRLARFIRYHPNEAAHLIIFLSNPSRALGKCSPRLVKAIRRHRIPVIDLRNLLRLGPLLGIPHWEGGR